VQCTAQALAAWVAAQNLLGADPTWRLPAASWKSWGAIQEHPLWMGRRIADDQLDDW